MKLNVYRYFIIRNDESWMSKENVVTNRQLFQGMKDKEVFNYYKKDYFTTIPIDDDDIWMGFLLKSKDTDLIIPEDDEIMRHVVSNWDIAFFAINLVNQTIMVQNVSSVFSASLSKNVLQTMLQTYAKQHDVSVTVEYVSSEESFWDAYEKSTKRYKISVTLNAPNLFCANQGTNEYLKKVKEKTNMNKITSCIQNEKGDLEMEKDDFDDMVDYASKGGGNWKIEFEQDGVRKTLSSDDYVVKENLDETINTVEEMNEKKNRLLSFMKIIMRKYDVEKA